MTTPATQGLAADNVICDVVWLRLLKRHLMRYGHSSVCIFDHCRRDRLRFGRFSSPARVRSYEL